MADEIIIDYGALRYITLIRRMGEATAEEKAYVMKQNEGDLDKALQMPMFKKLPTEGFEYDWKQFQIRNGGIFLVQPSRVRHHFQIINDHVKHFSPEEMDIFCAEVFHKATEHLGSTSSVMRSAEWDEFWTRVPQEVGIQIPAKSVENLAFWDWAMKLMAARFVCRQENNHEKLQSLTNPDALGDLNILDQPTSNAPNPKPLSLTAQAVDRFLAVGYLKFGGIARRRPFFGSHIGVGGPTWLGFTIRLQSSNAISMPPPVLSEPQIPSGSTQRGNGQAGGVDDLVVGMHSTTIEESRTAPRVFSNLAIRTPKPLKRRRDDTEESGSTTTGDEPLAKMAKVSESQANTSGSPPQLDEH
jgi:hypothetical protein